MQLRGKKKRCVEQIAREKHLTCRDCGSSALVGIAAAWNFGGSMNAYLECSNCDLENPLALTPEEATRCGFDPEADMQDIDEI
jgi:transcription elongation factor Elf1